jgi:hypothetical protein
MDAKEIRVYGVIKKLHVKLGDYPDLSIVMDIVVIDISISWGMFISRKWVADLRGFVQMDFSYATISTPKGNFVTMHREQFQI